MPAKILWGKPVADALRSQIADKIAKLKNPVLSVILVGNDGPSVAYQKRLFQLAQSLNIEGRLFDFPKTVKESEVLQTINMLNKNKSVLGIMPLMPMPRQINPHTIGNAIDPVKDLDCTNSINIGEFFAGRSQWAPATAGACMAVLNYYKIKLEGKHAVVIGRSNVVGKPVANLLLNANATVTVCHSKTKNLSKICQNADIIIAAAGKAKMIKPSMIKEGVILIDVGINVTDKGIVGDVSPSCYKKTGAYSPVPGGIGVVSNMMLLTKMTSGG